MAARNFLPRCIAFESRILNDYIGIRLKNAVHLGKKFLAAIFSVIVYWLFCHFSFCIFDSFFVLRPNLGFRQSQVAAYLQGILGNDRSLNPIKQMSYIILVFDLFTETEIYDHHYDQILSLISKWELRGLSFIPSKIFPVFTTLDVSAMLTNYFTILQGRCSGDQNAMATPLPINTVEN